MPPTPQANVVTEHYPRHTGSERGEVFQQHFRRPEVNQAAERNSQSREVAIPLPKVVCTVAICCCSWSAQEQQRQDDCCCPGP
eukprot:2157556-Heterocapsa_arctica.AAC.1